MKTNPGRAASSALGKHTFMRAEAKVPGTRSLNVCVVLETEHHGLSCRAGWPWMCHSVYVLGRDLWDSLALLRDRFPL